MLPKIIARFLRALSQLGWYTIGCVIAGCSLGSSVVAQTGASKSPPESVKETKEAIMVTDFFDLCYFADERQKRLYTPKDIESLMQECKAANVSSMLWRVSACGSAVYPSQVEGRSFRTDPRVSARSVEDFLERWDPLAEACRLGSRAGIPILPKITLYDDGLPGITYSKLLQQHPEYQWVDRSGKKLLIGVPSYAFPEARRFRVQMIEELCRYPIAGIVLSLRSHAVGYPSFREAEEYGYEQPVVDEFKRRYGVDIRTQDFDRKKWHALKGEYFTQLLREIRAAVGPKLPVQLVIMDWCEGPTARTLHQFDYATWAKENLVNGIYVQGRKNTVPSDFAKKYAFIRALGMKLYCYRGTPDDEATFENIPKVMKLVEGTSFQGVGLMEAYKFQILRGERRPGQ